MGIVFLGVGLQVRKLDKMGEISQMTCFLVAIAGFVFLCEPGGRQDHGLRNVGRGEPGSSGDGSSADAAFLREPFDAVFDKAGNLIFSDTGNHKIRKVDAKSGVITTVAGTGRAGFSGDGGPAKHAELHEPYGVSVDDTGNIYFADRLNRRVRVIEAGTGIIRTVAGNGSKTSSGDGGPASSAGLAEPNGVALDGRGALLIADVAAHRIRSVDLVNGEVVTLAGDGQPEHDGDGGAATEASIHGARAVEVGSDGRVYVVEREGNTVRAIDPRTGLITTLAGDGSLGYGGDEGPALSARFAGPKELAVSREGDLYVVDTENHVVRKVDAKSQRITTVAGTGKRGREASGAPLQLDRPHGVAIAPDGAVWVVDTGNHRLVRVGR
jgi:sugar lactone lactonase YvrE